MARGPDPFERIDPSDDAVFYSVDRLVTHIEAGAIEALRATYAHELPKGGAVLDLMSSWRSHLPPTLGPVTGLGMNAAELAANDQLETWVVHDLNAAPHLPFDDASFDACVCAVSVQYLTRPLEVWADVRRALRPGAPCVISFSNRCFPTKAVRIWRSLGDEDHLRLVSTYLTQAGFSDVGGGRVQSTDDPLWVVTGRAPSGA